MEHFTLKIRTVFIPPVLVLIFLIADVTLIMPPRAALACFASGDAWPGWAVVIAALLFISAAVLQLRLHRTTLDPLHPDKTRTLITRGLFRLSRNPIYLGFALLLLGVALVLKSMIAALLVVLFMVIMTWLHIRIEERHLRQKFGAEWLQYAHKTRRWL